LVLGGVDVAYNTMNNQDGHWQAHLYLLLFARDRRDLRDSIRARCPPEPTAMRPYEFAEVRPEDYPEVVSYAVKGEFYWRSSFTDVNGRTNGRGVSLKPEQAVEAALFLDQYPLGSRLLLKGIKRFYTAWGCTLAKAD
jgi:hypothetical protein